MRITQTLSATMMTIVLSAASCNLAEAARFREIRDWQTDCNDALTCRVQFSDYDNKGITSVTLKRKAIAGIPVDLVLPFPPGFEEKGDARGAFSFVVDGAEVLAAPLARLTRNDEDLTLTLAGGPETAALIEAMKTGKSAALSYRGDLGSFTLKVSLSGVTGSLLFVDETQGRLKRTDALVDRGPGAPQPSPVAEIAGYADLPEKIQDVFADEDGACHMEQARLAAFGGVSVALSGGRRLILVPCGEGGAYNQPYAVYAGKGEDIEEIGLPVAGGQESNDAYNLDFDYPARTLTSVFKGRGIGDCGTYYRWRIAERPEEPIVRLEEQREKGDCDGNVEGVETWPLVWPKKK